MSGLGIVSSGMASKYAVKVSVFKILKFTASDMFPGTKVWWLMVQLVKPYPLAGNASADTTELESMMAVYGYTLMRKLFNSTFPLPTGKTCTTKSYLEGSCGPITGINVKWATKVSVESNTNVARDVVSSGAMVWWFTSQWSNTYPATGVAARFMFVLGKYVPVHG